MIRLVGNHNRRELAITFGIWAVLLLGAIGGLFMLRARAVDIINHIYYVNVPRGSKATVLYAEAEKNARRVMEKFQRLNAGSAELVTVPQDDQNLQQALSLYEEALTVDPQPRFSSERTVHYEMLAQVYESAGDTAGQRLAHAQALFSVGDDATAMEYIQEAREADAEAPEPLVLLARAHLRSDNVAAAKKAVDEVYAIGNIPAGARQVKAELEAREGRPENAVAEMELAVEASPENLDYRSDLASYLGRINESQRAAKVMQDGLAHGGWLDPAYLHRYSRYLADTDDLDEAIRVLEQADRLAPYSGDVQFFLASLYNKVGKKRQAASALRRATEVKPELQDRVFEE